MTGYELTLINSVNGQFGIGLFNINRATHYPELYSEISPKERRPQIISSVVKLKTEKSWTT